MKWRKNQKPPGENTDLLSIFFASFFCSASLKRRFLRPRALLPNHDLSPLSHQLLQPGWLYASLGEVFNPPSSSWPPQKLHCTPPWPTFRSMPLLGFVILQLLPSYPSTNLRAAFTSIRPETSRVQCDIEEQLCLPCKVRREVRAQRDADWKKLKGISCFYKGTFVRNGSRVSSWIALFFSVTPFLQILQWRVLPVLGATLLTL